MSSGFGLRTYPRFSACARPLVMRPLAPPGVERDICLYTSPSRLLPDAAAAVLPRLVELLRAGGSL